MWNKIVLVGIIILFLFTSCNQQQSKYRQIAKYLKMHNFNRNLKDFKTIYVITAKGECIECNNDFAEAIVKRIKNSKNLFIVSQDGTMIDISSYLKLKNKKPNIIYDYKSDFDALGIVKGSSIIRLENKQITKITTINSQNIDSIINNNTNTSHNNK